MNLIPSQIIRPTPKTTKTSQPSVHSRQTKISLPSKEENDPWGDELQLPKKHLSRTRIYTQNINGLHTEKRTAFQTGISHTRVHEISMVMDALEIEILGLAETNTNWTTNDAGKDFDNILQRNSPGCKTMKACSTQCVSDNSCYQPGGNAMILGKMWATRIRTKHIDPLGRWSGAKLIGNNGKELTILQIYRAPKSNVLQGLKTAYAQQTSQLHQAGHTNPDPHTKFQTDFATLLKQLSAGPQQPAIIVMGDFNLDIAQSSFATIFAKANMVDVHRYKHYPNAPPETYIRGTSTIDYIMVTSNLLPFITSTGMEAYNASISSDHRGLWMECELEAYLEYRPQPIENRVLRNINSSDRRQVHRYRKAMMKYWNDHKLTHRMALLDKLCLQAKMDPTEDHIQKLIQTAEAFDRTIIRGQIHSEKCIRPRYQSPWSPKLIQAKHRSRWWRCHLTELLTGRDMHTQKRKIQSMLTGPLPIPTQTIKQTRQQFRKAQLEYRQVLTYAPDHRDEYLVQQIEHANIRNEETRGKILKNLRQKEEQMNIHTQFRKMNRTTVKGALTYIRVPYHHDATTASEEIIYNPTSLSRDQQADLIWRDVRDPQTMMNILIERNRRHYSQAEGTPFTQRALLSWFGRSGCTPQTDDYFDSQGVPSHHSEAVQAILKQLRDSPLPKISTDISVDDVKNKFHKWNELTSTSPSGVHLGHYRAMLPLKEWEPSDPMAADNDDIGDLFYKSLKLRLQIAIQTGHSYERWKKIITCVLEKKPGNPRIDKIRIIHLLEADANSLIGMFWNRRLIKHAETHSALHKEQWGNRKNKSSIDPIVLKMCSYQLMHLTQTGGGTFDNDAKSCYDRIVMSLAILRGRQLGLPVKIAQLTTNFLQQAQYHVKSNLNTSEEYYSSTKEHFLHGPGQGTIFGPPIWLVVSTLIMELVSLKAEPLRFECPAQKESLERHMDGFVDDTTGWTNDFSTSLQEGTDRTKITHQLTQVAQWWENLLSATGGMLELPKCFFYLVLFEFDDDGLPRLHIQPQDETTTLTIKNSVTGTEYPVHAMRSNKAHKTLGVMLAPDLSNTAETNRIRERITSLCCRLTPHRPTPSLVRRFVTSVYRPSINYSAPISNISKEVWHKIQAPFIRLVLRKLTFPATTPDAIIFASVQAGGLGLTDGYREQGLKHVSYLMNQIRSDTIVATHFRITLKWAQHTSGLSQSILSDVKTPIEYIHFPWLHTTRQFLRENKCHIEYNALQPAMIQRAKDEYIMDKAARSDYSTKVLRIINACRLYLQATTIADITDSNGTQLQNTLFHPTPHTLVKSILLWPYQPNPPKKSWKIFYRFLKTLCKPHTWKLRIPLGGWTEIHSTNQWPHYWDTTTAKIFTRTDNSWQEYSSPQSHRTWIKTTSPPVVIQDVDYKDMIPISQLQCRQPEIQWSRPQWIPKPTDTIPYGPDSFTTHVHKLPEWEKHLLQHLQFSSHHMQIITQLQSASTILLVSDGGARPHMPLGGYGWVLATEHEELVTNRGWVTGWPMQSFRAEGVGRLSAIVFLTRFLKFYNTKTPVIHTYLDNIGVIQRCEEISPYSTQLPPYITKKSDADVILAIQSVLIQNPWLRITTTHVKGHQDRTTNNADLTRSAQLNVRADSLATEMLDQLEDKNDIPNIPFPTAQIHLFQGPHLLTGNTEHILRFEEADNNLQRYLADRLNMSITELTSIDWISYGRAKRYATEIPIAFTTKLLIGWLPTRSRLAKYDPSISPLCHECNQREESDHPWKCSHHTQWKSQFLTTFSDYLKHLRTDPTIHQALCTTLSNALESSDQPAHEWYPYHPDLLLAGLIPSDLTAHQSWTYLSNIPPPTCHTGEQWATRVIRFIWTNLRVRWRDRCNRIHDPTPQGTDVSREITISRVKNLLSRKQFVNPVDHHWFPDDMDHFLTRKTSQLESWLMVAAPAIEACIQRENTRRKITQHPITRYFHHYPP